MADKHDPELWGEAHAAIDNLLRLIRQAPPEMGGAPPRVASMLTQAYLLALSAALRCLRRLATECGNHRELIASFVLEGGKDTVLPAQTAVELRELARTLGDAAVAEAEQFRSELEQLADSLFVAAPRSQA